MALLALTAWELIFYCFIFIVGLFGNVMVCLVVLKSPAEFRSVQFNIYLFSLAIVDLCLAVVCLPVYLFSTSKFHHPGGYGGLIFCKIITGYLLPFWLGGTSIYILVFISFERYRAVSNPLFYRTHDVKIQTRLNIAFAWFIGFFIQLPTIIGVTYTANENDTTIGSFCMYTWKEKTTSSSIYAVAFTLQYVIPASIFIINFCRIKKCIGKLDITLRHCLADRRSLVQIMRNKRRTIRIVFITCLAFFVCWTPNNTMYFLFQYGNRMEVSWDSNLYQVGIVLGYFNSCINPLLYAFQSREFRKHCKNIMRKVFKVNTLKQGGGGTIAHGTSTLGSFTTTSDNEKLIRYKL